MENTPKKFVVMNNNRDIRLTTLILSFDEHTLQFSKILKEITERELSRFGNYSKSIPWLVGSQVQLRFEIANLLGIDIKQAADELFQRDKNVQLHVNYPSLGTFRIDWDKISPILRNEILELDNEDLFTSSGSEPKMKGTFFDLLSFAIEREKEIIETLTVWRGLLI